MIISTLNTKWKQRIRENERRGIHGFVGVSLRFSGETTD
jgi:hypothetical protein